METLAILFCWFIINGTIGLIVSLWTEWVVKIYWPKSKKYDKLKDPIYEIQENYGYYYVVRHTLGYDMDWYLFGILPCIFVIYTYGYVRGEAFCTKFKIGEEGILEYDIKHFYESTYNAALKEAEEHVSKVNKRKAILKEVNQEFIDNHGPY